MMPLNAHRIYTEYMQSDKLIAFVFVIVCGVLFCLLYREKASGEEEWRLTKQWLKEHRLDKWSSSFRSHGIIVSYLHSLTILRISVTIEKHRPHNPGQAEQCSLEIYAPIYRCYV